MIIDANNPMGHHCLIDILQIESIWKEAYTTAQVNGDPPQDDNSYFCRGVSGTIYHLSEGNYTRLLEHWKANGSL